MQRTPLSAATRIVLRTLGGAMAFALVACGGATDDGAAPTTVVASAGATTGTAPVGGSAGSGAGTTSGGAGQASSIEGTWVASVQSLLVGAAGALGTDTQCTGDVIMVIGEGRVIRNGSADCTDAGSGLTATAVVQSTGAYTVDGDQVTFSDVANGGTFTIEGQSIPFPDLVGGGTATFTVSGDELTITPADAATAGGSQVYTRRG